MEVLLLGASGMVGQGVLRECLRDPLVTRVVSLGRSPAGVTHPKLREILRADLHDLTGLEADLSGLDACFFCLGVSSVGMKEDAYRRVTYDLTLAIARSLSAWNPRMTFVYVSGAGTDSSERGRSMWARVKGKTENNLLKLPFRAVYLFRPGLIRPLDGIRSKTRGYQVPLALLRPLMPALSAVFPHSVTDTRRVGRAMIRVASHGAPRPILEARDINEAAEALPTSPKPI